PNSFGTTFNLPGKEFPTIGALAPEMPEGIIKFWSIDPAQKTAEFKPGIQVELQPFPGTLAVGIDPNDPSPRKGGVKDDPLAPVSTLRPWKNGSNMDINELQAGSKIFIPVFIKGGLIWTGDSHCRQGNGEVSLTGLECSYKEIVLQPIVRKDMKLEWPRLETRTHWITTGFDEDLNKAMVNATREAVNFLAEPVGGGRVEALSLAAPDQDPHAIELKPAQLARLRDAALLVRIGLDHEPWLARLKVDCPVVDASQGVRLLQTETPRLRAERQAHSHAYGNTHYWLDPQNARPMTASILEALSRLSPADRP